MEEITMMERYIAWFHKNYPKLQREMSDCRHNYDDRDLNPYHLESDCWSHTMMVCKIAEMSHYDKVVQIAALLHDIGKPQARKINPRNHHVQFFGHEALSAQMAEEILLRLEQMQVITEKEKPEVIKLIEHHSLLYKLKEPDELKKHFDNDLSFCKHLVQLSRCDSLGRFCPDLPGEEKYEKLLKELGGKKDE